MANQEKKPQEKICVQILNWAEYAGTSRSPFYFRIPMRITGDRQWDVDNATLGFMVRLLAIAGSSHGNPGVIVSEPARLARALHCHPDRLPKALRRLEDCQLIQILSDFNAAEYRREVEVEEKKIGHSVFPDWVFDQVGLQKQPLGTENGFLTRDVFANGIFQVYPKPNVEAFDRVFSHLSQVIYDERWLAFVQTCLRNYSRRKREESDKPTWHKLDTYFFMREWWNDFRKDSGAIPRHFNGSGEHAVPLGIDAGVNWAAEHNISTPVPISN